MKNKISDIQQIRSYLLLWFTQMISGLGSAMTAYALVIWSYTQSGLALQTALLMVCSYAPYVICSIFAGALSDRWNKKKTMLVCDTLAALSTLVVLCLLKSGSLKIWHLYVVNAVSGLMNTVQQPASEVATTALLPKQFYQKAGGLRYLSNSLNSILTPIITTAVMGLWGMDTVIAIDLVSFLIAFVVLLCFIPIPEIKAEGQKESVLKSTAEGVRWLRKNSGIFHLMLFLAAINLVASMYNAAFPAMMLSKASESAMGVVNTVIGITTLFGSILASLMKAPKSRVKAIWYCLMLSMCTENFFLAFGDRVWMWCVGAALGWIAIPLMNANLDAVNRLSIPIEMQGRVFAARNSFQFFTIPLGYFLGGLLVDRVFEPIMAIQESGSTLVHLFGSGKGSGAAFLFAILWLAGIGVCVIFRADRHIWRVEPNTVQQKSSRDPFRKTIEYPCNREEVSSVKEQILAVQRMQDYIEAHLEEKIGLSELSGVSLFSPWHSYRLFQEYTGLTPATYIRRLRLARAALRIKKEHIRMIDAAFDLGFGSVDGFTRAFTREFGMCPGTYANRPVPITLFVPYGAKFRALRKERTTMKPNNIFIQVIHKPKRKVICKRGIRAEDYFSYCEEVGCDVWGTLLSMDSLCGEPVCLWLPERFKKPNTSTYVQGVEVAGEYSDPVPEGFDAIDLPAADYLMFQGEPFAEEDYCEAISAVQQAMNGYDPGGIGYAWDDANPRIQLEPRGSRGYIELKAVKKK